MKYTNEEILFIQVKKPEFRVKPVLSLDAVIVEFLKKYEVFVQPTTSATRNTGESAVAGAITGMAGADVGGDAFMISGQNKQTKVQEWTQWKQWALDHKDFEEFKKKKIEENQIFNKTILEKINSDSLKEELEKIIKPNPIFDISDQLAYKVFLIGFLVIFGSMFFS